MASPKCPHCGGILVPETMGGMALCKQDEKGLRTYNTRCLGCGRDTEVVRTTDAGLQAPRSHLDLQPQASQDLGILAARGVIPGA